MPLKLFEDFRAREVVIDGTGLGVGLLDFMVRQNVDDSGNYYPAFGVMNDSDYINKQPKDAPKNIFVIKLNPGLNSEIHSTCFAEIMSGKVRFLIKDQDAKQKASCY